MTDARFDAVVIGAGANGLVAAAALARAGRRVAVVEAADALGGQSRAVEFAPGFSAPVSVDSGWLLPSVSRGLGIDVARVSPEVSVTVRHGDGFLALPTAPERAASIIRAHSARDAARWPAFAGRLAKLAGFLGALYQAPPPDAAVTTLSDLASLAGLGRRFRALGRVDMSELLRVLPMSIQDLLEDEFETPCVRAAVAAGGVRDIRQGPRSGGTSFVLLHYLLGAPRGSVRARGWWRDGPAALADAAAASARDAGAAIRTSARVREIIVRDDAVAGVALATGDELAAPLVISTADPVQTLLGLVDPVWLDPELIRAVRNIKLRACTAVVHYAVDRAAVHPSLGPAELASVVSLTRDVDTMERAYDAAKYGTLSAHPHIEITVPTARWPRLAPSGTHVVTAHVQYVPREPRDGPWTDARRAELEGLVTAEIARAMPGFAGGILHRAVYTPEALERTYGATGGALTHGELTLDQILFMRPVPGLGRHATPIDGLYLGGAGSHPGPGVPGGAGWLAARAALSDKTRVHR